MLILILVALWMVVLAPAFIKRHLENRSTGSIDSFHRSLHLLERTGPKLVPPAYRLDTAHSTTGLAPGQSGWPPVSSTPGRRNLVLLKPLGGGDGGAGAGGTAVDGDEVVDEVSGQHYLRVHPDPAEIAGQTVGQAGFAVDGDAPPSLASRTGEYRAEQARRRRRDILIALAATVTLTALIGIVQALHPLWIVTILAGVALAGYLALAAYAQTSYVQHRQRRAGAGAGTGGRGMQARRQSAERRQGRRGPQQRDDGHWGPGGSDGGAWVDDGSSGWDGGAVYGGAPDDAHWAAVAGFPGAWDDDYAVAGDGYNDDEEHFEPRRAAAGG